MKQNSFSKDDFPQWCVVIGIFCLNYIELILIFLALLFIRKKECKVEQAPLWILGLFTLLSLEATWSLDFPIDSMIKQVIVLFLFILGYGLFFSVNKSRLPELFHKYLLVSIVAAALGGIQYIIYRTFYFNIFYFLYSFEDTLAHSTSTFRVTSFVGEPGYLASLLLPALVFLMSDGEKRIVTWLGIILLVGVIIFTDSSIGLLGIFIIVTIQFLKVNSIGILITRFIMFAIVAGIVLFFSVGDMFQNSGGIQKIYATASFFFEDSINEIEIQNKTTYALLSNLWVARHEPRRLFGVGLGNHRYAYEACYQSNFIDWGQNKEDAYSLLIRIYSETGLLGMFILFLFLKKINFKNRYAIAASFVIIAYLLRGGNYFLYGTIFFFYFAYYASTQKNDEVASV